MEEQIVLQPFDRILSGYEKRTEVAVAISDCSQLCEQYQSFGVQGYRLGDYQGASYLNRYINCSITQAPLLIYKKFYLIPLVFRASPESSNLFLEKNRMAGFFYLLDWLIKYQPKKAIINYRPRQKNELQIIDSAFVAFRLSEILDGGGFPISQFKTLDEFIYWNREHKLVSNPQIGRHSRIFDVNNRNNLSELQLILKIIQLKYPETTLFV